MSAYVDQSGLELQFTPERVAEVFSAQLPDGSTSGSVDVTVLAACIRMGCARVDRVLIPTHDMQGVIFTVPFADTLKQIAGIAVMHEGMLRRPEYQTDSKKSPYYEAWQEAKADLKEIRVAMQRLSADQAPKNVGGQIATSQPCNQRPFTFLADPRTGRGGFNSGGF